MLYPPRYRRSRPCVVVLHCDDSRMRITDTMEILIRSVTQIAYKSSQSHPRFARDPGSKKPI